MHNWTTKASIYSQSTSGILGLEQLLSLHPLLHTMSGSVSNFGLLVAGFQQDLLSLKSFIESIVILLRPLIWF